MHKNFILKYHGTLFYLVMFIYVFMKNNQCLANFKIKNKITREFSPIKIP